MTDTASATSTPPPPDTAPSAPATPAWTRWLYPILAMTGIAVGIFVIVACLYILFAQPNGCHPMMKADPPAAQSQDCCASMMKDMKMPMGNMPSMPSTPNMPMPTPGR